MFISDLASRRECLIGFGASTAEVEELLIYNHNGFQREAAPGGALPQLDSEAHVADWTRYQAEAAQIGNWPALRSRLVQFQFPVQAGISKTGNYLAATRRGALTDQMAEASGLLLQQPDDLSLTIHATIAGAIPVIIAGCRSDFVMLVQALTRRNEPEIIPDSMGAVIIGGYNNWDRVRQYRQAWTLLQTGAVSEEDWQDEFQRLIPQKSLYQDRFILLSRGAYSAVPAAALGLTEADWLMRSLVLRLEHEACHYFTRRMFGSMRNNVLDELIADYQGIVGANGNAYRADWFLHFVGLESFPAYRAGGRLENYLGSPPLSAGAVVILQGLVKAAAEGLERFNRQHLSELQSQQQKYALLGLLTCFTLEELVIDQGRLLEQAWVLAKVARAEQGAPVL